MYDDVVAEVAAFLRERVARRCRRGHRARAHRRRSGLRLRQDASEHNLALLRAPATSCWRSGCPLLAGWSRKSIARRSSPAGRSSERAGAPASRRRCWRCSAARASCACTTSRETVDALKVWQRRRRCRSRQSDAEQDRSTHEQNIFRHRRHPRHGRRSRRSRPTSCCASAMPSAACCKRDASSGPTVLIGKDTRISGYMLEVGARGGLRRGRRRRAADRPAADARRRLPDARAAARAWAS